MLCNFSRKYRITSYNVCYTKLLRFYGFAGECGKQGQYIVVGHDKRFSGEHFAAAVAEVLAANGFKVWLTDGATPTPVISYAVVDKKAAGAVNITARITSYNVCYTKLLRFYGQRASMVHRLANHHGCPGERRDRNRPDDFAAQVVKDGPCRLVDTGLVVEAVGQAADHDRQPVTVIRIV